MRISDWSSDVCSSDLLWIFAGPNGSGKSTVYSDAFLQDFDGSIWIINPDLLTTEIKEMEGLEQQAANLAAVQRIEARSEEHTSELQSLMRISYAVFCLQKKHINNDKSHNSTKD